MLGLARGAHYLLRSLSDILTLQGRQRSALATVMFAATDRVCSNMGATRRGLGGDARGLHRGWSGGHEGDPPLRSLEDARHFPGPYDGFSEQGQSNTWLEAQVFQVGGWARCVR
jgi:hypothetical protein